MNTNIDFTANLIISVGWIPVAAFVVFYAWRSPWRSTALGRAMMQQALAMLVMLLASIADAWWDNYLYNEWVHLVVYSWLLIATTRMFLLLRFVQNTRPPEDQPQNQDESVDSV